MDRTLSFSFCVKSGTLFFSWDYLITGSCGLQGPFHKKSQDYDTHLGHLHPFGETQPVPFYANKL